MFRNSPGFTATAVVALMIGIGANAAIFSVINAVLLKPAPFPEPDRLVQLMISANGNPLIIAASASQFIYWRDQIDVFDDVAAYRKIALNYARGENTDRVSANQVSEAYFRAFRAPIALGRRFTAEEDLPGAARVTVVSHDFWTRRLGADPGIVGKAISLSGDPYTVVGVVGPEFDMREYGSPELWVPLRVDPGTTDVGYLYQVAARLNPTVTLAQAQNRLEASVAAYRERFPSSLGPRAGFSALTMQEAVVGRGVRTTLFVLLGAVTFVLLIACANVANLLLVRANVRRHELAIRSALGASRGRILQQLLIESALLSAVSGTLGLIAGFLGMRALLAVNTAGLPRLGEAGSLVSMDWRVVAFTVVFSLATAILFGLVPALVGSRTALTEVIKTSESRAGGGSRLNRMRSVLVMVEVGLAVVLLVGAALLIRTSLALNQVDPGFNTTNLLTVQTSLSGPAFLTSESVEQTVRNTRERLHSVPGVIDAVATCCIPLQLGWGLPFNIIGRTNAGPYTGSNAVVFTSPGYFETFEIPVVRGRAFDERDNAAGPPVVIINEALARQHWRDGGDPLEDRMRIGGGAANLQELAEEPVRQVVGIVGDIRGASLADDPGPVMYVPQAQLPDALNALVVQTTPIAWVVRTQGDPRSVMALVQEEVRGGTGLPVTDLRRMEDVVSQSLSRQRLHMLLMSVFAGSALLLAAIGIFGLMAYAVQQRTHEIGLRMALGAAPGRVSAMVIRQGMLPVMIGLAVGLVAAYFLANVLASILFEVEPRDPAVFTTIPVMLVLVALTAVAIPAARASRMNPLEALRYD
jgi:predicted permease